MDWGCDWWGPWETKVQKLGVNKKFSHKPITSSIYKLLPNFFNQFPCPTPLPGHPCVGMGEFNLKNTHSWRGEQLRHHGCNACDSFVVLWLFLWRHKLIACRYWCKHNLKMRLSALLFDPHWLAPYLAYSPHEERKERDPSHLRPVSSFSWCKYNLKIRLLALLFDPHWLASYLMRKKKKCDTSHLRPASSSSLTLT